MAENFKITTADWPFIRDPDSGEDKIVFDDSVTPKITLGNFIKIMISYEIGVEDDILNYFGSNFSLLYYLLKKVNWSDCMLLPNGSIKKDLSKRLKIKDSAYEGHLRNYVRLGLLMRIGQGEYMVNPMKVFVGEAEEQRRLIIEFARIRKRMEVDNGK